MIDTLQRVSQRLRLAKPVFIALGVVALCVLGAEIFMTVIPQEEDALLIPSAVLFLWALIGFTALNTFPSVPQDTGEELGFFARLKLRFARFFYYGLALVFVALTLVALYMSYKLISIYTG